MEELQEVFGIDDLREVKLLCVEDESDVAEWFLKHFKKLVPNVMVANDGKSALELYQKELPDIVITDIMMPQMNGLELCRAIRKISKTTKLIVVTAYGNQEHLLEAIEIGVDRFLTKPISLDKLDRSFFSCAKSVVTEKQLERKKEELARIETTDALTLLPNRKKLIEELDSKDGAYALAILNVDSFKEVNDFYGHLAGDEILRQIAVRTKEILKHSDCSVFKLSADEYALLERTENRDSFIRTVSGVVNTLETTIFLYDENDVSISLSAGMAFGGEVSLLTKADMALKEAKRAKKSFVVYEDSLKIMEIYSSNIMWSRRLREALREGRVVPFFQPVICNKTQKVIKHECLVRMIDGGSVISPFYFLEISKKNRLYPKITRTMLGRAIETFSGYKGELSVNVCVDDMLNQETREYIFAALDEFDGADRVTFEILESEKIEEYEEVRQFIHEIKKRGSKIAIDDFGSGYSNFEHILRLDVDYIKIDASMIKNIDKDKNSQIIVDTIVGFARRLGIETIAEFVHSKEVYDSVRALGVDMSQGYYFSEPLEKVVEEL